MASCLCLRASYSLLFRVSDSDFRNVLPFSVKMQYLVLIWYSVCETHQCRQDLVFFGVARQTSWQFLARGDGQDVQLFSSSSASTWKVTETYLNRHDDSWTFGQHVCEILHLALRNTAWRGWGCSYSFAPKLKAADHEWQVWLEDSGYVGIILQKERHFLEAFGITVNIIARNGHPWQQKSLQTVAG